MDKSTIFSGSLTITENLEVLGTASYIHTEDLKIKDKNIEIGNEIRSKDLLNGAGITFGVNNLGVNIAYSSEKDRFVPSVPVDINYSDVNNTPEFKKITFETGTFEGVVYDPVEENISVKVPTRPEHIGAFDSGSFSDLSASVNLLRDTASNLTITSSVFAGRLSSIEVATQSINSSVNKLNTFTSSISPLIDVTEGEFLGSASHAKEVNWENVTDRPDFISSSWTGSKASQFSGTASYALSVAGVNGFLPLSGGALTGKLTVSSALENGIRVTAEGDYSHAEGAGTLAKGIGSHTEGNETTTQGQYSHAEGKETLAQGGFSHAEGLKTVAIGDYQHVIGTYNLTGSQYKDYLFIIGNGEYIEASSSRPAYESRSNAFAVDRLGNIEIPEGAEVKGTASYALVAETLKGSGSLIAESASHAAEVQWTGITNRPSSLPADGGNADTVGGKSASDFALSEHTHSYLPLSGGKIQGNVSITGSIATGYACEIKGGCSHAEGYGTKTQGYASHAEGSYTLASGDYSHVEGFACTSSGTYSHAEGYGTIAQGQYSHAEGDYTVALGDYSHVEGFINTASGISSHAEGTSTVASGNYSHAEGDGTIAQGDYQHVSGKFNIADTTSLFIIGNGTYGHRSNALTVSPSGDVTAKNFIGTSSYALAAETVVGGLDYLPLTGGNIKGNLNITGSVTNGRACLNTGQNSHAEGNSAASRGEYSHAEGNSTTASGSYAHAEGSSTKAINEGAHAEGTMTTAYAGHSHAEGDTSVASGSTSHAEGSHTTARGIASHAEGYYTIASSSYSHAEGNYTLASGRYAHSAGDHTKAAGFASYAGGQYATSSATGSIAVGRYTEAEGNYQTVVGTFNLPNTTSLFVVGNGTADNARSNALTVEPDGTVNCTHLEAINIKSTIENLCTVLRSKGVSINVTWDSNGIGQFN